MVESTEQATGSPEKSEQTGPPPGITEAISRFEADQAKQAAEAKAKEAPGKVDAQAKAEETTPKEDTKPETKEAGETEEGKKEPIPSSLTLKVAGKEVTLDLSNPEDRKKLETWSQQGYDFSQRNQSLNEREALIGTQEAVLKAVRDGKLVPADKVKPPEKEQAEPEPELDLGDMEADYPEVATYLKSLQKAVGEQKQAITFMNQIIAKTTMESAYKELTSRIDEAKKEHNLANDTEIWNMLKEVDENHIPRYTPEEAVRISHENEQKKLGGHIERDGYVKIDDDMKQKIYLEMKQKEDELNKAPVSSPSGLPAGGGAPSSDEKRKFSGITEAVNAFIKDTRGASKAKTF